MFDKKNFLWIFIKTFEHKKDQKIIFNTMSHSKSTKIPLSTCTVGFLVCLEALLTRQRYTYVKGPNIHNILDFTLLDKLEGILM